MRRAELWYRTARLALSSARIAYYPVVPENPYQQILYSAFDGHQKPLALQHYREIGALASVFRPPVLHVHWEQAYAWTKSTNITFEQRASDFMALLHNFLVRGGQFVWTVHDDDPYVPVAPDSHEDVRRFVADHAAFVHVHSESGARFVAERWGIARDRIEVIAHPSYISLYPPVTAKVPLLVENHAPNLLFFGSIRAYKNLDGLASALDRLPDPHRVRRLTIAGRVEKGYAFPEAQLRETGVPLDLRLGFIPEADIPAIFADAGALVLPYNRTLNSGAALLGIGFGVPVIAPDLGAMRECLPPENAPLIYDPAKANGLRDAIATLCDMPARQYAALRQACLHRAETVNPRRQSELLLAAFQKRGLI